MLFITTGTAVCTDLKYERPQPHLVHLQEGARTEEHSSLLLSLCLPLSPARSPSLSVSVQTMWDHHLRSNAS